MNAYDTGEVLEPIIWDTESPDGMLNPDRFGKVDFDDDEGATRATVYATRNQDGTYTLHVIAHDDTLAVETDRED